MNRIFQRIQERIGSTPDMVCLSAMGENKKITLRELDVLSGKVYRYLRDHGIGREDFVNILLPRGVETFIAMLGVWKAGAAFVVLEEGYPAERIAFIQKDCGCRFIIDGAAWEEILRCEPLDGFAEVNEHDAAFAVYTSGTTGTPKGVLHEYGNLDPIAQSLRDGDKYLVGSENHFAMIAPLNFVAAVQAYICALDAGPDMSVVPYSILKNPPVLGKAFVESGVDTVFCAPSIYRLFRKIPTLKKFFVGSEPANGIWSDDPEIKIINTYNMSETAFSVAIAFLDCPNDIAPVGRPFTDMKITLRDEEGNPVPDGETGELCVENPFVRGYINRPEENARAFVNGEYHTHDLARKRPDGQYEVIGRIDDMIKISGNRVEPAEIEAAARRVTGLQQVVARGFGEGEDAFICLYYADPVEPDIEEVRKKLGDVLPYYMIPSHFIHLDELPRTATGKISRRLLPKPAKKEKEYVAPENETARAICEAMASVLGMERFSAEEDFYRMGGSSITSMEVVGACSLPGLSISQIFRGRTPNRIAEIYLAETRELPGAQEDNLNRACPLTQSQLGIFLECEMHEGEAVYNNPMLFRLGDDTDTDRLADAVDRTMRAHPGLFAAIGTDADGQPIMRYSPEYAAQPVCERERITEAEWEQRRASLVQPFFIMRERLFRMRIFETESHKYLFMDFHHIVFDGTSMQIIGAQLQRAFLGEDIEAESWTAFDAAAAENAARQGEAWKNAKEWYLSQFGEAEETTLPQGDLKAKERTYGDLRCTLDLSANELSAACEKLKTSENVISTAAFGMVLASYTTKKEALFSTIYNGRRDPRTQRTVSMFVTTLPVLCRTGKNRPVTEYLDELKEQMLGSMANDIFSFAELAAQTAVTGDAQFAWQTDLMEVPKDSPLQLTREELAFVATGSALTAELYPSDGRMILHIQYHADRFSGEYIARFAKCFGNVLRGLTVKEKMSDVKLLDAAEENEILELSRGRTLDYDASETWLDLFMRNVRETPDKTAVTDSTGSYTYGELDKVSDRIAAYLIGHGVKENSFVAVKTDRVKEFPAAIIGIQKAGAAYVPIDPEYPEDRIAYMLEDSEAQAVLTEETIAQALSEVPEADSIDRATPTHRAYMIYTSGSTGKPKGVVQSHRSLRAYTEWRIRDFELNKNSIHAVHPSFAFDASLDDLICPLAAGGEIHIISDELRKDMAGMNDYFRAHRINAMTMSTQIGMAMVNQYPDMDLRFIMMGGEKMLPCAKTGIKIINGYGPTEFTVCSSYHIVDQDKDTDIPIGRAVPNTWSVICDADGRLLPQGAAGELCLAGPQVAEGYWKRKELTDEKFIPFAFTGGYGGKMYRTGDLAKYNKDGELEFLGRIDTQVKLRGFRIELGEIENTAGQYEGILHTAAEVIGDQLVLYFTANSDIDRNALRAFLSGSLTEYMVPTVYVQLDEMPMTPNGKIDRKVLRAMPLPSDEVIDLPENETEQKLVDLIGEVLPGRKIGVTTELASAGLTSIGAMRFSALISKTFDRSFKLADLKENGTIRQITEWIASAGEEEHFDLQDKYPISTVQQGVYVECLANPDTTIYNEPVLLKLDRDVDTDRLKQAMITAVDAHPYLKMRLTPGENGRIMAERRDSDRQTVTDVEIGSVENGFAGLVRPFDLTKDSLFRTAIIHDGDDRYLFMDGHHIVVDGESIQIILNDVNRAYAGETPETEHFTGFEFALLEEKLRSGAYYEKARSYYTGLLDGSDTDCLPVYDREKSGPEIGHLTIQTVPDSVCLAETIKDGGVTLNGLWNAAFGIALSKFLYREDCIFTTVYNGRNDPRLSSSVGMFVHTLPVVCRPDANELGREFAKRIGQQLSDSMANDIFSFAEISGQFDVKANILFVYQGRLLAYTEIGGKSAEPVPLALNALKAALTIFVAEKENGFEIICDYDAKHYEEWSIRALLEATARVFGGLISDLRMGDISLVGAEERQQLDEFNRTEKAIENTDIVTLFRRAAKAVPSGRAVIFNDRVLTYAELDSMTDNIAAYLQERGIGKGDVVSVLIPRSEYMPITALGVLKTGAAYQPLDPGYPAERLAFMTEDSGAKVLIEDESLKDVIPGFKGEVLYTRDIPALPEKTPADTQLTPDSLFILLYTSGTTGRPKGVMLCHRNLVNFCAWYRDYFELTADSTVAAYASFGFDVCMMDMYTALTTGACLCIVPEEMRLNLPEVNAYFEKNCVTHSFMTTQMARMFATTIPQSSLKYLLSGGEKLVPFEPEGNYTFYNGYGPTECTIFATIFPVTENSLRVPIGQPLDNYRLYVADRNGSELPVGALGELWIAGYGVGLGYLNLPEKTAKSFIPNPFCNTPGYERVYRTGDIVRRLPDGRIDFIGRNDGQVKIRGFRIELSEVESVIRQYDGIKDATVQAFDDPAGGKFLAAYLVSDKVIDHAELAAFIRSKKPDYMVPAAFIQIDSIPLNQNQKVNKKKLPLPVRQDVRGDFEEPATPLEKELCEQYAKILGLEKVGAKDNFFEIGGSSISAANLLTYAMGKGYPIVYKDIFSNPSPRQLAAVIEGAGRSERSKQASDYDYSHINRLIAQNTMAHIDEISAKPVGDVILTGATGFLGIHVLHKFIEETQGKITCLIRSTAEETAEDRLRSLLMYYFDDPFVDLFGSRIFCVEGDITDKEALTALDNVKADVIINCAANVKHFVKDDILDRINYHGVENLIEVCLRNRMRLVQISTLSVGGEMNAAQAVKLYENNLYIGQYVDNDYVRTKFLAERAILEAKAEKGLDAVILRAGNLMGRYSDGEFQINLLTNAFMRSLAAFNHLGACPVTSLAGAVEFSPIDATAGAVLTLAGVDNRFSIFHINNNHFVTMGDIVFALKRHGMKINIVTEGEFARIMQEASGNDSFSEAVTSLVAYNGRGEDKNVQVESDNYFTTNVLYRLDYKWPIVDDAYLEKVISAVESLEFFNKI